MALYVSFYLFFIVAHITNVKICSRYYNDMESDTFLDPVWLCQSFSTLYTVEPDCNI